MQASDRPVVYDVRDREPRIGRGTEKLAGRPITTGERQRESTIEEKAAPTPGGSPGERLIRPRHIPATHGYWMTVSLGETYCPVQELQIHNSIYGQTGPETP